MTLVRLKQRDKTILLVSFNELSVYEYTGYRVIVRGVRYTSDDVRDLPLD